MLTLNYLHFILSSQHSPLHHRNSWKLTHPRCPSQGILPSSAIQALVSLSGSNWSVGWSCYPASLWCLLDVCGLRTLESLSVRKGRKGNNRLYIVWSFSVYNDGHKCGPTSRHVVGTEYKETVTLRRTYIILAIVWVANLISNLFSHLNFRITFWCSIIGISSCLVISIASYTKIFRALNHHQAQIQDFAQQPPSQPNVLNMTRYRKAVYSALWVQLALVVCYVPQFTVGIMISLSKKRFSNLFILHGMANVLVFFNSTLNPFLYCWKISEVRRAVKQTIRQAIFYAEG